MDYSITRWCEANKVYVLGPEPRLGSYYTYYCSSSGEYLFESVDGMWRHTELKTKNTGINSSGFMSPLNPAALRNQVNSKWIANDGMYNTSSSWWISDGSGTPTETKPAPKCECGTTITLGAADDPQFHSTWCPIYKKPETK